MLVHELSFRATARTGHVTARLARPPAPRWLLVLGHGAGAGMRHRFLEEMSRRLAAAGIATFRYQFPYVEAGRRRPDPAPVLEATVRAATAAARDAAPEIPLLAGGKSMGGRMTSRACAADPLLGVQGLVFFGFPLHPAGRPASDRAEHLDDVDLPMLFVQGDRDRLADPALLRSVCRRLGHRATLEVVEGADHGFHVLKRSGRTEDEVLDQLAAATARWAAGLR